MNNNDNWDDGFLDYMFYKETFGKDTSSTGSSKYAPQNASSKGNGCAIALIVVAFLVFCYLLGSCDKSSSSRTYRSSYSSGYSSSRSYKSTGVTNKSISSSSSYSSSSKPSGDYGYSSRSKSSASKKYSEPYDAKSYAHPDDFYYDHYDDFWDYEDAEEYYYEHEDD